VVCGPNPDNTVITSTGTGMGVLYDPNRHVDLQVYWGYPFTNFHNGHEDVQDLGFYFSLTLWVF
jgi:hypothetical protein